MTQFHTDPDAPADAKPDAETFQLYPEIDWYWHLWGDKAKAFGPRRLYGDPVGPFATEDLAMADAQTVGREGA